jgi:hypothetical protein
MLYVFFVDFFMNIAVKMAVFFGIGCLKVGNREWGIRNKAVSIFCFDTALCCLSVDFL